MTMTKTDYLFPQKWKIGIAIILVFSLFFLDSIIPPLGVPIAVICIFILFRWRQVSIRLLGLSKPDSWKHTILIVIIAVVAIQLFGLFLKPYILELLGVANEAPAVYETIEGNNKQLIIYLIVSWTTAGFGEELIFRTFFMGQFIAFIHNFKYKWTTSLVISSLIFGLAHYDKGVDAIIVTGIVGFILGMTYFMTNRNIWAAFFTHAITNTIGFLIIYSGLYKELY